MNIEEVNHKISQFIAEQVDLRVRQWLDGAKGADFTKILNETLVRNTRLTEQNTRMRDLLCEIEWIDGPGADTCTMDRAEVNKILEENIQ